MKDFSVRNYPKLVCQLQMFNRTEQNKSEGLYLLVNLFKNSQNIKYTSSNTAG